MKTNRIIGLVAALAAVSLAAGPLRASEANGDFTLPFQVSWGMAVLAPGHYTFALDRALPDGTITISQGSKVVAEIRAQGVDQIKASGGSALVIIGHRVRSLRLKSVGVAYQYAMSKNERASFAAHHKMEGKSVVPVTAN